MDKSCDNCKNEYVRVCEECSCYDGMECHQEVWRYNECLNYENWEPKIIKNFMEELKMETREYRCCMCPQREINETICPKGPGKEVETQCDFVVNWKDTRGRKYKVMKDVTGAYKGKYQDNKHMGDAGWKGMEQLGLRESFDKAQEDLNQLAASKGWLPIEIKV